MKHLAKFLGPYADLHTLWPGSIISVSSVGDTYVDVMLFNDWDVLTVAGGF